MMMKINDDDIYEEYELESFVDFIYIVKKVCSLNNIDFIEVDHDGRNNIIFINLKRNERRIISFPLKLFKEEDMLHTELFAIPKWIKIFKSPLWFYRNEQNPFMNLLKKELNLLLKYEDINHKFQLKLV